MENPFLENGRVTHTGPSRSAEDAASGARSASRVIAGTRNFIRDLVRRTRRNFVRELYDWARCNRVTLPSVTQLNRSISVLDVGAFEDDGNESPIFLLSTGWRSGSTLLQRILVTDPSVLLWGEPLGEMALISGIATMLVRLPSLPQPEDFYAANNAVFSSLATSWIATLCPSGVDFRASLRALVTRWLAYPARQRGFHRWGFKEVRMGAAEATLLHWLYPRAKFVLLSRNPFDCYRSLSHSGWHHLYYRRPDIRIDSAAGLARHWNRIALSWSELPSDFPAFRIKYEDLIGGGFDFRELESWLGVKLDEHIALPVIVGSTARRRRLSFCQRRIILREAAAGMYKMGYSEQE
jgi:Sulfotransferase family